ncbi:hypothetical protein E1287_22930 [Actinomadura sp. KC06]|uniref:hypothetical protein n=1 Tax=Actinomadura sp. KC06 TaxID=2530369 RepID=UPI001050A949|nr:hypothetical protein [Actinomadura sp. KC06]TDD32432.1 hypothetical protein E1287_22930 [Actinomadura sp. KC06]
MTRSPRRLRQQVQDTVGEQVRDLPLHAVRLAMFGVGRALLLGDRVTRDYKEITEGGGVKPVLGRLRDDVQTTAGKVVGRVAERVRGEAPAGGEERADEPVRRTRVAEPPARPKPAAAGNAAGNGAAAKAGEEISIGKPGAGTRHTPKHARPGAPPKPARPGALGRHHKAAEKEGPVAEPAPDPKPAEPKPEPAPQAKPAPSPKPAKPAPSPKAAKPAKAAKPDTAKSAKPTKKPEDEAAFEPKPETKPAAQAEAQRIAKDLPVPDYDNATLPQLRARLRGLTVDQVKLLREYERKHAAREDVIGMYERRIAKLNGTG